MRVIARLNVGGPAIHAVLLTQGLNDETFRSCLITGRVSEGEADMSYCAERYSVTPIVLSGLGREIFWLDDLAAFWWLYRFFRRERPDIVHTHTAKAGALGRLAAFLARVPIRVHTFHGHVFHGYFGRCKTAFFLWVERLLALLTDRIVVISDQQLAALHRIYRIASRRKFVVIPLGFDLGSFLAIERSPAESCRTAGQGLVVGVVGRMVQVKNHAMAVRVCRRLARDRAPMSARFIMVGDGPLRAALEREVKEAGLESSVVFTGWRSDLEALYRELDLVLLTSINEGTPVTLIEAMAAGLPFIATRVGGVVDLMVGEGRPISDSSGRALYVTYDNGILVESGDVSGAAAAVDFLAQEPAVRLAMGEAGRRFARSCFAKDRLLRDVRSLYAELLAEKRT